MAKHFFLNEFPTDSLSTVPNLVARLISTGGWVLKASGDGITNYDPTGVTNYFTAAAIAAASSTQYPWCRIKFPGSNRELCISKRNDGSGQPGRAMRIKYSYSLGFTDGPRTNGVIVGAIGANGVPSSADEAVVLGNSAINDDTNAGSGAVPYGGNGSYVIQTMIDDASPAFWQVTYFTGGTSGVLGQPRMVSCFMVDPTTANDPRDLDPFVFYISNMGGNVTPFLFRADSSLNGDAGNGQGPQALFRAGLTNQFWDFCAAPGLWSWNRGINGWAMVLPRNLGLNPYTGQEDLWPVRYFGQAYLQGGAGGTSTYGGHWKGISTLMKFGSVFRTTAQVNSDKSKISFEDIWLDWDGVTAPRI